MGRNINKCRSKTCNSFDFQEYLLEHGSNIVNHQFHYGIALFTKILLNLNASPERTVSGTDNSATAHLLHTENDSSVFTSDVALRSHYIGEVNGFRDALLFNSASSNDGKSLSLIH